LHDFCPDTLAFAYVKRGHAYTWKNQYDKATEDYAAAIRLDPRDHEARWSLAWLLATCPRAGLRDGKRAVEHARKACELSGWNDANSLSALAASHAECGDFKKAVRWEKKVIEFQSDDKAAQRRLKLYEQNKPYRSE